MGRLYNFFLLLSFAAIMLIPTTLFSQEWNYEISCAGVGVQGTYLVEVTSYGKTVDAALAQMKKDAVHGVLFRGFTGKCSQKPLAGKPEVENNFKDYFKVFFSDKGDYGKYVVESNEVAPMPTKVGKQYKVTKILSVKKDLLRRDLEKAGIIKPLGM